MAISTGWLRAGGRTWASNQLAATCGVLIWGRREVCEVLCNFSQSRNSDLLMSFRGRNDDMERKILGPQKEAVTIIYVYNSLLSMTRSYHPEHTGSHQNSEVKLDWARLVLC